VTTRLDIQGRVAEGWGAVADAFRANFERRSELGAACCVYADGHPVVDLWGGAWDRDTLALVFSTTKGATAICAHMLAERGALDLDARVADYWPEFAAAGKDGVLVRWLLSHQAGLPFVDAALTLDDACAWEPVTRALQAQRPLWEPGTRHAYHPLTYGFLVGEVVRRAAGMTVGRFLREEIAGPLALDAWIGLPEDAEPRVAQLELMPTPADPGAALTVLFEEQGLDSAAAVSAAARSIELAADPGSVAARGTSLGGALADWMGAHTSRAVRAAESPATNLVCDARSLARMYAATVSDVDGTRLLAPAAVEAMCVPQTTRTRPYVEAPALAPLDIPWALGFMRPSRPLPLLGPRSFGHGGFGGSVGCADPESGIGFAYIPTNLAWNPLDFGRAADLLRSVRTTCRTG
jgi:CubicO group peptidase (beta-lactamase class C family)